MLLPLQVGGRWANPDLKRSNSAEVDKLRAEVKRFKDSMHGNPGGGGKDKGWGKDKGKGKGGKDKGGKDRGARVMPKELMGMASTFEGKPLCFNFSMRKGCSEKSCPHQHVCALPTCGSGSHACHQCPKRG